MDTYFYDVGPPHRQETTRQTKKQMSGLFPEYRRSALVQSCKESKSNWKLYREKTSRS